MPVVDRIKALWPDLTQGLWFTPGLVVIMYAILAIVLVEVDHAIDFTGVAIVFKGDGSAARTVLSVLAGSLITVAGLTFSTTVVALQLASSQFSPRVLRTFFGDRITQVTVGSYVGIFVYSILVLRAVGDFKDGVDFVPRLSITIASALGIGSVVLLILFIHHITQMIQVSRITASIARQTLERVGALYPDVHGGARDGSTEEALAEWRRDAKPGLIFSVRPGFVRRVGLDVLAAELDESPRRLAILVHPGDFVSPEAAIAEVWPADAAEGAGPIVRSAVAIADERDIDQDVAFGLRQLTDIGVRALSPGINDPTTAVTCVSYIRSVVVQLAGRALPSPARSFPEKGGLEVFVARRTFADYVEPFLELGRYVNGDAYVTAAILKALEAVARVAVECGAPDRAAQAAAVAEAVGSRAGADAKMDVDRRTIERLLANVRRAASATAEASDESEFPPTAR